ncbi:formin-binding protein 4-like isoform X2 [Nymphalis io]|uniref:formin-binding protein 4-like isoform X2 n=1 Tax=Inachis io TaxID=171585 RepID=UPI0021691E69|nr:formin-binding protein 4-like isoform X2 [Nymphalis io]
MSKLNPLGLLVNYGDSDEDIDDGSPLSSKHNDYATRKTPAAYPSYEASYQATNIPAGIHPAPIPHCPWSACYDENSGFTYYWNQQTNAVTWEAPPEYMLALKLAQQQLHISGSTEVSAEEWQLYQQALAEKQNSHNKVIAKTAVNTTKKPEKGPKEKNSKTLKKRAASDDEDEKIELITSYHNSDSESNDESEKTPPAKPPLPKPPNKLPKHPQKKQKTKPQVEFGPPLPPNQNYTVPIGPELPTVLPKESKPKSPEKVVDIIFKQIAPQTSKTNDDDVQDEKCLLQKLRDKAKLLEKLGGELPSDIQKIIKDDTKSSNVSPRGESNAAELDIDDLLEEIEKTELPKVVKSKDKINERQQSKRNSITNSPKSGDRTPSIEDLNAHFANTNGPLTSLFPSAVNIDESKLDIKPEPPVIVEKEKKENLYLMKSDVPLENIGKKKLRISNSVLPERKKEKFELPVYTTKYSQFIEGFSNERTGLGFTKEEDSESSPKNTINYGNGLTFTKGETLNEEKKDEDLDDLTDLVEAKLKFLNQLQPCVLSPLQEMLIQMQTLVSAFRAGALSGAYWRRWARGAEGALAQHEAAAAPPGWLCVFQRSEGRYCYRRESDGFVQYEYPAVANTDMDICTTPPHPSTEPKEVNPPPPPPSPPRCWRSTPPPPGTDPGPPEAPSPPRIQEPKKEIGDELQSFYNDIAELEKTSGSTEPNSPEPPPPPEISDKTKDKENKVARKKSKMKVSSSLGMKHKSVSTLVAKWQQVADEINSD